MRAPRWVQRAARPTRSIVDELTDEEKIKLVDWLLRELPEGERAHARGVVFAHLQEPHTIYSLPDPEWYGWGRSGTAGRRAASPEVDRTGGDLEANARPLLGAALLAGLLGAGWWNLRPGCSDDPPRETREAVREDGSGVPLPLGSAPLLGLGLLFHVFANPCPIR